MWKGSSIWDILKYDMGVGKGTSIENAVLINRDAEPYVPTGFRVISSDKGLVNSYWTPVEEVRFPFVHKTNLTYSHWKELNDIPEDTTPPQFDVPSSRNPTSSAQGYVLSLDEGEANNVNNEDNVQERFFKAIKPRRGNERGNGSGSGSGSESGSGSGEFKDFKPKEFEDFNPKEEDYTDSDYKYLDDGQSISVKDEPPNHSAKAQPGSPPRYGTSNSEDDLSETQSIKLEDLASGKVIQEYEGIIAALQREYEAKREQLKNQNEEDKARFEQELKELDNELFIKSRQVERLRKAQKDVKTIQEEEYRKKVEEMKDLHYIQLEEKTQQVKAEMMLLLETQNLENARTKENMEILNGHIAQLSRELLEKKDEIEKLRKEVQMKSNIGEAKSKLKETQEKYEMEHRRYTALRDAYTTASKNLEKMLIESNVKSQEIESLKQSVEQNQIRLLDEQAKNERDGMERKVKEEEFNKTIEKFEAHNKFLMNKYDQLQKTSSKREREQLEKQQKELQRLRENNVLSEKEIAEREDEIRLMQSAINRYEYERNIGIDMLRQSYTDIQWLKAQLEAERNERELEREYINRQMANLRQQELLQLQGIHDEQAQNNFQEDNVRRQNDVLVGDIHQFIQGNEQWIGGPMSVRAGNVDFDLQENQFYDVEPVVEQNRYGDGNRVEDNEQKWSDDMNNVVPQVPSVIKPSIVQANDEQRVQIPALDNSVQDIPPNAGVDGSFNLKNDVNTIPEIDLSQSNIPILDLNDVPPTPPLIHDNQGIPRRIDSTPNAFSDNITLMENPGTNDPIPIRGESKQSEPQSAFGDSFSANWLNSTHTNDPIPIRAESKQSEPQSAFGDSFSADWLNSSHTNEPIPPRSSKHERLEDKTVYQEKFYYNQQGSIPPRNEMWETVKNLTEQNFGSRRLGYDDITRILERLPENYFTTQGEPRQVIRDYLSGRSDTVSFRTKNSVSQRSKKFPKR